MAATARPRWAIGNWKMHLTAAESAALADALLARLAAAPPRCRVAVAPAYTALAAVAARLAPPAAGGGADSASGGSRAGGGPAPVLMAAQDLHPEPAGAFTGAIAAPQLVAAGCAMALVGHSEVRARAGEAGVPGALGAALRAGLAPVLCVGESAAARAAGAAAATAAVVGQVRAGLAGLPAAADLGRVLLAYEPVWAIGGGGRATDADIAAMHAALRAELAHWGASGATVPLLYGGSVRPADAAGLASLPDVDGLLVGGASLDAAGFATIAAAV